MLKYNKTKFLGVNRILYSNLSGYLRKKYGSRLKKICIDGGFSCPNRDGTCGEGGCIFCGERGAGEHIDPTLSIKEQVAAGLQGAGADDLFIAYFQNYTNTYAPTEVLKERYDSALTDGRIRVLLKIAFSTIRATVPRPDYDVELLILPVERENGDLHLSVISAGSQCDKTYEDLDFVKKELDRLIAAIEAN